MQRKWHRRVRGWERPLRALDIPGRGHTPRGGERMEKGTYAGKIGNGGTQHVKAIFTPEKAKKGTVKTGSDLRVKGGK